MADIFSAEPLAPTEEEVTLDTLVGETQKYKTPDELAKAYSHAESFIENAKREKVELEAELKVLRDLNEARSKNPDPNPNPNDGGRQQQPDPNPGQKVDSKDLSELVREELASASEEKRRADNINRAAEIMANHYGSPAKANEAIRNRAKELDVSTEWLQDAASKSPAAFLASMGIDPNARSQSTPAYNPDVNLGNTLTNKPGMKGFKYWEEMRKTSPKTYHSSDVQKAMFTARRELGDKFYTT